MGMISTAHFFLTEKKKSIKLLCLFKKENDLLSAVEHGFLPLFLLLGMLQNNNRIILSIFGYAHIFVTSPGGALRIQQGFAAGSGH